MKSRASKTQPSKVLQIFKFFVSTLLWTEKRPQWSQYAIQFASNIQLIATLIYTQFNVISLPLDNGLPSIVKNISQTLSFMNIITSDTPGSIIDSVLIILCIYFLLFIAMILYLLRIFFTNQKISSSLHIFFSYWGQLHHTIFFWIANVFLMFILAHHSSQAKIIFQAEQADPGILALCIMLTVINYIFGIFAALYCYDPFLTKNALACHSPVFQINTFIYKALMCPLLYLISSQLVVKWVFEAFSLAMMLIRYELLLRNYPYFTYSAMRLTALLSCCSLSVSIANIAAAALFDFDFVSYTDIIYVEVILALALSKITMARIQATIFKYHSIPTNRLQTAADTFKKMFAMSYIIDKSVIALGTTANQVCNLPLINVLGGFASHHGTCKNEKCLCKVVLSNQGSQVTGNNNLLGIHKVNEEYKTMMQYELLSNSIKQFKSNRILKILCVYILFKKEYRFSAALFTLLSLRKEKISLREEALTFSLRHQLEEEMAKYFQGMSEQGQITENVKAVVDFERMSDHLLELIEENTQNYIKVWTFYKRGDAAFTEFLNKTRQIEKLADEIQSLWNKIASEYSMFSKYLYPLYGLYLILIRNMPHLGEKISLEYDPLIKKIFDNSSFARHRGKGDAKHNVVFYVEMSRERLGRVTYVSRNVYDELGWTKKDLLGQNINMIQPTFLKDRHHQILLNHIENTNQRLINAHVDGFVQKKEGYLTPVHVYSTIFPYIEKDPIYVGIINKRKVQGESMIITPTGMVDSFSKGLANALGLAPYQKVHIDHICKNFKAIKSQVSKDKRPSYFDTGLLSEISPSPGNSGSFGMRSESSFEHSDDSEEVREGEMMLNFQPLCLHGESVRDVTYAVKVQTQNVLGEHFMYVNLSLKRAKMPEKRSSISLFRSSCRNFTRVNLDEKMDQIDEIPDELDEFNRYLQDLTKDAMHNMRTDHIKMNPTDMNSSKRTPRKLSSNISSRRGGQSGGETNRQIETGLDTSRVNLYRSLKTSKTITVVDSLSDNDMTFFHAPEDGRTPQIINQEMSEFDASVQAKRDMTNKLEKAVYMIPQQRSMRILDYLITLFGVLCTGLLYLYIFEDRKELDFILQKVDLISTCQQRTLSLIDIDTNIQKLILVQKGIINDDRYGTIGIPSVKEYVKENLLTDAEQMNSLNHQAMRDLFLLASSSQDKIYSDLISLYEKDTTMPVREVNGFDAFTELAAATIDLGNQDFTQMDSDLSDAVFVMKNSLNNPLLVGERFATTVIDDCNINLNTVKMMTIICLFTAIGSGAGILVLLSVDLRKFLVNRSQFIEILLRLDQEQLEKHIELAKSFHYCFSNNIINHNAYLNLKEKAHAARSISNIKKDRKRIEYKGDKSQGLNTRMTFGLIFTFASIIIFGSVFIVLNFKFTADLVKFTGKINQIVEMNQYRINLNILNAGSMEYESQNNSTTIRNNNIEEELDSMFDMLTSMAGFLTNFADATTDSNGPFLSQLMKGDICTTISIPNIPSSVCEDITTMTGTKGIVLYVNFLVKAYEDAKSLFDDSNRTLEAASGIYNQPTMIFSEELDLFSKQAFEMIEDIMKQQLRSTVGKHEDQVIIIIAVYVAVYVVLGMSLSLNVWKNIKDERRSWRKIMRQIPYPIVLSDKLLKAYLIKNCEGILDSIKSSL